MATNATVPAHEKQISRLRQTDTSPTVLSLTFSARLLAHARSHADGTRGGNAQAAAPLPNVGRGPSSCLMAGSPHMGQSLARMSSSSACRQGGREGARDEGREEGRDRESGEEGGVRAHESNTRREGGQGWDRDSNTADKHRQDHANAHEQIARTRAPSIFPPSVSHLHTRVISRGAARLVGQSVWGGAARALLRMLHSNILGMKAGFELLDALLVCRR